jgi:hypothetical protein
VVRGLHHLGYSERRTCALIGFGRSTYYGIKFHRPSDREIHQLLLEDAIKAVHERSRGTYGRLRIKAALEIEQGLVVSVKVIAKLMKRPEIQGLPGPRKFVRNRANEATSTDLLEQPPSPLEVFNTLFLRRICAAEFFSRELRSRVLPREAGKKHCEFCSALASPMITPIILLKDSIHDKVDQL